MADSIYRGFAFPFTAGSLTFPEEAYDDDLIKQALVQLVTTGRGERVMRPDVGCNAMSFVMESNDDILAELIRTEVMSAIARFEPRVIVRSIDVVRDEAEGQSGSIVITINYVVVASRSDASVVVRM